MSTEDVGMWAEVEADFDARVERALLLEMAIRINDARLADFERAERRLADAVQQARSARVALTESTAMLERACRVGSSP